MPLKPCIAATSSSPCYAPSHERDLGQRNGRPARRTAPLGPWSHSASEIRNPLIWMNATCILPAACILAEGPVWHEGQLWWVDIEPGRLHRLEPGTKKGHSWAFPHRIGFIVPSAKGDFIVGADQGLARFSPESGSLTFFAHPEAGVAGNRFNDAKCDAAGRLWAGTMAVNEEPERGALYRIDPDLRISRKVSKVSISNGLAWSPDGRTLFYIDSPTRRVDAFDFEPTSGEISGRRTVIRITDGFPDGMCADQQGNLWIAIWGGGCVACYNPHSGQRLAEVRVPVEDVTSCCFGPGSTLFITTSSRDVKDPARSQQPLAGGIFEAHVGVSGPASQRFGG